MISISQIILAPFTALGLLICVEEIRQYCINKLEWDFPRTQIKDKE